MSVTDFRQLIECNEPVFEYSGDEYSICFVNGKYIAGQSDLDADVEEFDSIDSLIDNWRIAGTPFREILSQINIT